MLKTLQREFPSALRWDELLARWGVALADHGFNRGNTLCANVICRDEINQRNMASFAGAWGPNFELAGLAGFPSGGLTAFSAYKSHVPDDGYLLIVFGPHMGVSSRGELGRLERPGMDGASTSCGSVLGFLGKLAEDPDYTPQYDRLDAEQYTVESSLIARKDEYIDRPEVKKAIHESMYRTIEESVLEILDRIHFDRQIALIGGLIINTPHESSDFFVPRRAEILNAGNSVGTTLNLINAVTRNKSCAEIT